MNPRSPIDQCGVDGEPSQITPIDVDSDSNENQSTLPVIPKGPKGKESIRKQIEAQSLSKNQSESKSLPKRKATSEVSR
jgi:hypothetical protein